VASPLLANVYLHYVFDLWAERWRQREATGDMVIVRYADDAVVKPVFSMLRGSSLESGSFRIAVQAWRNSVIGFSRSQARYMP
jgi:hypothetical protein